MTAGHHSSTARDVQRRRSEGETTVWREIERRARGQRVRGVQREGSAERGEESSERLESDGDEMETETAALGAKRARGDHTFAHEQEMAIEPYW